MKSHSDNATNVEEEEELEWTRTFSMSSLVANHSCLCFCETILLILSDFLSCEKLTQSISFKQKLSNLQNFNSWMIRLTKTPIWSKWLFCIILFSYLQLLSFYLYLNTEFFMLDSLARENQIRMIFFIKSQPLSNCNKSTIAHTKEMHSCKSESVSLWCIQNSLCTLHC